MQMNAPRPKNDQFSKACSICFANRNSLREKIDEIDYELSECSPNGNNLKKLFHGETGKKCVLLLVLQMKYQYELYHRIESDADQDGSKDDELPMLLNECNMPKITLEMMENHHKEPQVEHREEATYACLEDAGVEINCESLIHFVEKFLDVVINRFQDHRNECKLLPESCIICNSRDMQAQINNLTPLLETFEISPNDDIPDIPETEFVESTADTLNIIISFDSSAKAAILQEDPDWERFNDIVLQKYKILQDHYIGTDVSENDQQHPVLLLYRDHHKNIKEVGCISLDQALERANNLEDIISDPYPVVLISSTDNRKKASAPNVTSRKRMVQKRGPKVGTEDSPCLVATLKAPEGRESFEIELLFYLDTGADSGSVGFNLHIISHFVLTVENINGKLKPAIICKIRINNDMDEDIHVFDVDEDSNWNAIGLSVLKRYRMYIDVKNNKVVLGKHEYVEEVETEDSFQVTFKKDGQTPILSIESNGQDL